MSTDAAEEESPAFLANLKYFRVFVTCLRITTVMPIKKVKYASCRSELGQLLATSAMHACRLYWETCKHIRPQVLHFDGTPKTSARLKFKELRAEEIA